MMRDLQRAERDTGWYGGQRSHWDGSDDARSVCGQAEARLTAWKCPWFDTEVARFLGRL